ncbi:hybrid sensor histidine kinase/response regulator [Methanosphaerula palustris]|uniref:Multi-sensor signal transduction histidine kinase n=1 Tax=Methanosphaerula palustris (strain ATCC BAA-1556 / DSM 19958 / E1-9c) TaxID=521011 RepID=B8GFT1_METPE|nr:PAS domain S-box protein [Methanosphaerula palustris]ACL17964.1 multi-sensor signal transduction histidine kinase [Methanosphaerula palustris E1-9c]
MIALLLVDDEPTLLEVARLFLERSGMITVTPAESPGGALALLKETPFDVIVSDYEMPGMNGIELLKIIRSTGNTIPFIIFTGKGREQIVIEALNQGADFYLQKGGDPRSQFAELEHKVKRAVAQQKSDLALRQSEERFRLLAENGTDMISCHTPDGTYRYASPACIHLLGYQPEELIGHAAYEFIHPDDIPKIRECAEKAVIDSSPSLTTYRIRRKDGRYCWVESTHRLIRIPGQGLETQVSSRDISARKVAEEQAWFQMELLNHISQAVVVTDPEGTIVSWNRSAEVLYGWKAGEARGKRRDVLIATLTDEPSKERITQATQGGEKWSEAIAVRRRDNLVVNVRMSWCPLHNQNQQQIGAVCVSEEVNPRTDRTNLYLDIMTHDINNAVMSALGYADCLSGMLDENEASMTTKLQTCIRHSIEIIDNISTIRKIAEEQKTPHNIDLDQVIKTQITHFPGTPIHYNGQRTIVSADDLLGGVLTNLIGNSRKFAGPKGTITIRVEPTDQEYLVSVEDNGPGIPDNKKQLIFNRFQRGAGEENRKGLGLYIAQMLVERYGGRIWADDRVAGEPGEGAAIRFTLPVARDLTGCEEI